MPQLREPGVLPALTGARVPSYPCQGFRSRNIIVGGTQAGRLKHDLLCLPLLSSDAARVCRWAWAALGPCTNKATAGG